MMTACQYGLWEGLPELDSGAPGDMGQERSSTSDERLMLWVYIPAPGSFQHPRGTSSLLAFTHQGILGSGRCGHHFPCLIAICSLSQVLNSMLFLPWSRSSAPITDQSPSPWWLSWNRDLKSCHIDLTASSYVLHEPMWSAETLFYKHWRRYQINQ